MASQMTTMTISMWKWNTLLSKPRQRSQGIKKWR
jgi:hypothetical protein